MVMTEGRARRLLVIYNPTSGRRKRRKLERFLFHLDRLGAAVTLRETTAPRHAEALARAADPAQVDAVLVAGGDGTINEAVNGLAGSPLPLTVLPLGTANVLANEIGLPRRSAALARIAAFAPARPVWPGEAMAEGGTGGARRFLIMAGLGFDAEVVEHLDLALKRRTGKLAYVASIFGRLRDYRPCFYRGEVDGAAVMGASLVAAKAHFYGGRFVLAPAARLEDPSLQIVVFEHAGRSAALGYMAAMSLGLLQRCRSLRVLRGESVRLLEPAGAALQLDGDIQLRLPARIGIASTPLKLVAP
ncbi:MAG TPA: diacylglycerol kinase family protein [Stellaceae bacterium]|jgi:diacylglycerol kinase (ATP)|nr:diacylglycerol kinase family protein [Stellaceae bacterium]